MELDSFVFSAVLLLAVAAIMVALFKRLGLGSSDVNELLGSAREENYALVWEDEEKFG